MAIGEAIISGILAIIGVIFLTYMFLRKVVIMDKKPKFEIFKDAGEQFRFRFIAPNGEIIGQSEAYTTKQACLDTVNIIVKYASKAKIIDLTVE